METAFGLSYWSAFPARQTHRYNKLQVLVQFNAQETLAETGFCEQSDIRKLLPVVELHNHVKCCQCLCI